MKKVSLSGSLRENVGKKDAKGLRRQGLIPCVLYGGNEQVFFHVNEIDLKKLVYTPEIFQFELSLGNGEPVNAIIQDLQFHPVTDRVVHVDFLELIPGKETKIDIPISYLGNSIGVRNGGRFLVTYRTIAAKGKPEDFPDAIEVNIEDLKIGDKVRVGDISSPGMTLLASPNDVVAAVKTARAALVELELEGVEGEEGVEGVEGEEPAEGAPAAEGGEAKPEGGEEKSE